MRRIEAKLPATENIYKNDARVRCQDRKWTSIRMAQYAARTEKVGQNEIAFAVRLAF